MADEPLLLSGAKAGVLVEEERLSPLQIIAGTVGVILVLIGAVDVISRVFSFFDSNSALREQEVSSLGTLPLIQATTSPQETARPSSSVSTPTTRTASAPLRLRIPKLSIDAPVEHVGVNARGEMASPSTFGSVAWYERGPKPGQMGNAVIAGHLNNALSTAGVFERLHTLSLGDAIEVKGASGEVVRFIVREMTVYPESQAPREEIFAGDTRASRIVLITCNGAWDHDMRSYDKRLVVIAERAV